VTEGYTCHDTLQNSGKTIKMTVEGQCASIATVILLSAKLENRSIYKNATVFIHNPFIPPFSLADAYSAEDLQAIATDLKREEVKLLDFYVEKTGADRAVLAQMMKDETTLNADQAIQYGFVSKKIIPVLNSKTDFINNQFKNKMTKEQEARIAALELQATAKATLLDKMLAKLGLKTIGDKVAMEVTTADGTVLTVDGDTLTVGGTASPDGTFVQTDGTTVVVAGGVITEITEAEPVLTADEIAALQAENAQLKADLQAAKDTTTVAQARQTEMEAAVTEATTLIAELKGLKSSYVAATRKAPVGEPVLTSMQAKIKAEQDKRAKRK
jgi:ATP-dependent Clp protease protease subunit